VRSRSRRRDEDRQSPEPSSLRRRSALHCLARGLDGSGLFRFRSVPWSARALPPSFDQRLGRQARRQPRAQRGEAERRIKCRRRTLSRVLFRRAVARPAARIIHLGDALLRRSSTQPGRWRLAAHRAGHPRQRPYSSLLREGLAPPPVTRLSRVGSYPTISTLPVPLPRLPLGAAASSAIGGVVSVALSLGSPRVAVSDLPALWSPDFPPAGLAARRRSSVRLRRSHSSPAPRPGPARRPV